MSDSSEVVFVRRDREREKLPGEIDASPISIIIAVLLGITLFVLIQYLITDITKTFVVGDTVANASRVNWINKSAIPVNQRMDFTSKELLVSTAINVPVFVLALVLMFGFAQRREAWKLPASTYFVSSSISMLILVGGLVQLAYQLNQKLTTYGVSILLLIVFTVSVVFVQERWLKQRKAK